mmetsp:Transcript_22893/g.29231  ORF Transcript_22893/g.29231 Transcript_22893/m.29231 type:complete len:508 (+) Transcript_22893:265-1788(+)|eukprot:CAMPEP_0204866302 /NCGR_PEP_ID=MMETSP1348-20121228/16886_1 /ASSEMBLY_ACC=CAM_ASM_000700 /TAXON_ID=215587 /ORGANISM="Aplanochytrium stocchinoi, Strain GSBS06" /LENGTH=507 /DNA_ID=CAMNT_0052018131 /DNA_START=198 /DNA_END=1721 /DNA_ORIENTATION=-
MSGSTEQVYLGAIDQGTTSTRFIIFTRHGEIVAVNQIEHKQIMPREGWVEHDPMEIWQKTLSTITGALNKAKLKASELSAVGITNQRETTVVWSKSTGQPLYNAIVWMDMRTRDICRTLSGSDGKDRLRQRTGLPIVPYFAGTKLKWLLDNVPGISEAAANGDALFGTIDSWLMWNLSGGKNGGLHLTDVTNASRTLLMNIETLDWDPSLCKEFSVPQPMLPKIVSSSVELFKIKVPELEGVPLSGVLGDQQAALFGQTCFDVGEAKNTYGTGCFMLLNTGEKLVQSTHGLLTTVGYKIGNQPAVYALEGSVAIGGALVQWLRDNLNIIDDAPEVEKLALQVEDNGGVYFVPAFSGLYAPYWRDDARGVIVGLTRFANKCHIARATLEATAFQTTDVFKAMEKDAGVKLTSLKVDGGMTANKTLLQFQSDVLDIPVILPEVAETTALGAAYAAGLGVGVYKNIKELKENWKKKSEFTPEMTDKVRNKLFTNWKKAIERTLNWEQASM